MKSDRRRIFAVRRILVVLGLLASSFTWAGAEQEASALKLTVLYMNDAHAHYLPYEEKGSEGLIGGFAKARTVIVRERARAEEEGRKTLILYGGDLLMGTHFPQHSKVNSV